MSTVYLLMITTLLKTHGVPPSSIYTFQEFTTPERCQHIADHVNRTGQNAAASCMPK